MSSCPSQTPPASLAEIEKDDFTLTRGVPDGWAWIPLSAQIGTVMFPVLSTPGNSNRKIIAPQKTAILDHIK